MIETTKDYRTRDEKLNDFQTSVAQTTAQLSDAVIRLQNRVTLAERAIKGLTDVINKLQHDQRG